MHQKQCMQLPIILSHIYFKNKMHNSPKQRDRKLKKRRKRHDQRLVIHTGSRIRKLELTRVVSNKIKKEDAWNTTRFN